MRNFDINEAKAGKPICTRHYRTSERIYLTYHRPPKQGGHIRKDCHATG